MKLRFVIEGEHLDGDGAEEHEGDRNDQQSHDAREERPAPARAVEQGLHDAVVEPREPIRRRVVMIVGGVRERGSAATQDADGGPRRDSESDHDGEQHRRSGTDGNRAHVGAHQAADKGHRQNGGDHGPGGEDRGVAYFVDGGEGDVSE